MDPVRQEHSQLITGDVLLALFVTFIFVALTYILTKRLRRSTNVVIFTGQSNSGKTAMFCRIVMNQTVTSVSSIKEQEATIQDLNLKLIDLPGADRLNLKYWDQYKIKANHVIFFLDSTVVEEELRKTCDHLYALLSDSVVHKNKVRFTIACNKQDHERALKKAPIRNLLEMELNAIRETEGGKLKTTSDEVNVDYVAKLCSDGIIFDRLGVSLIETSVHNPDQLIKVLI